MLATRIAVVSALLGSFAIAPLLSEAASAAPLHDSAASGPIAASAAAIPVTAPPSRVVPVRPSRETGRPGIVKVVAVGRSGRRGATPGATSAVAAPPTAPYTECPAIGGDASCGILVNVTDGGSQVLADGSQGPFDGSDDTLIGLLNSSSQSVGSLTLSSGTDIFGFDGDGICSGDYDPWNGSAACPYGPTGYEGPGTSFTDITPSQTGGVVVFSPAIPPGGSAYFSLEEPLDQSGVTAGGPTSPEQGGPSNPSENPTTCSNGDPVNCATGVFWHTFTDFSIPGRGVPLDLTRTYSSSQAAADGPFGHGWTDSYDMSLAVDQATGDVTITQEDGSTVAFAPNGSGGFVAPPRVLASLARNGDGSYTLVRFKSLTQYNFNSTGQLVSEVDNNGYQTVLGYNGGGQLAAATDPAGRQLTFTYTGAHITKATDPMGRTWTYAYDANGNLSTATDPMGRVSSFSYDAGHLLLTMTDPRGGTTTNVYNASAQVVSQTNPTGAITTWAYSGSPASSSGGTTTITDPNGNVTSHQYADLELLSVTRAYGTAAAATTTYKYDPVTLGIASVTDPNSNTTTNTFDSLGNLLTTTSPLGDTTQYAYNGLNEVTQKVTPLGEYTTYDYDGNGNLLSLTDPDGGTTTYAYGDAAHPGDVTSVTDPDGHVTTYTYDAYGDLGSASKQPTATVTDTTDYAYDADGERSCVASPNAVAAGIACPQAGTAVTTYDADGEVTSVTDPDGHVTSYAYDANGNKVKLTDAAGHVTSYAYDAGNQQTTVTAPDGTVTTASHDPDGNIVKRVNAAGKATAYSYDALNQVVSVTDPLGHQTTYAYDLAGNRIKLTDAEGQVTSYTYDAANELTGISYSGGSTPGVAYTYDAVGHRVSMTDGTGTTAYSYDADGQLTGVTNGAGAAVGYGYDEAGLLTTLTYPNSDEVSRTYDGAGELVSVQDWLGNSTTFSHDHDGNVTSQADPNGVSAVSGYNAADQLTGITDKAGSATLEKYSYTRDKLGDVSTAAETPTIADTHGYSYTQLTQLGSDNGANYGYDQAGDLTAEPGGVAQAYNADSQLTTVTTPGPVKPPVRDAVVSANETSKSATVTSAALTAKDGDLVLAFVSAKGPSGQAEKVTKMSGGGLTWKLVVRSDGQQGTAEIWQAPAATALTKVKVTATLAYKGYDGSITLAAFTGAVGAHASASGAKGAPAVALTTTAPDSLVWAAGEDPSHAAARIASAGQALVSQFTDAKGGDTFWTQQVTAAVAKAKSLVKVADTKPTADKWDLAAVEILAAAPSPVSTAYGYNKDGDLTAVTPPGKPATTLTYNQANALTGYGTSATYAYDGDGLRMSKAIGTVGTAFAWDQSGALPLLIAAGTMYYVYGPGGVPIEQVDTSTASTAVSYLLVDQSASVRLITGPTGTVTGTYTYGPYGAVTSHSGSATASLQYDGQYTDAESGLVYLQARYYNPASGQFLALDPIVNLTQTPYSYASDNPTNNADPSGQCPMCLTALIGGIGGGVAGLISGGIDCFALSQSGGECAASLAGGFVGGAVAGACAGFTGALVACGAAGGVIGSLTTNGVLTAEGKNLSDGQWLTDAVVGGVGGGLLGKLPGADLNSWSDLVGKSAFAKLYGLGGGAGAIWGYGQGKLDNWLFPDCGTVPGDFPLNTDAMYA
jgi:RHS repeat-associated protein